MTIQQITVEHQVRPLGLAESRPRFSWTWSDTAPGFVQTWYAIQVSSSPIFETLHWDSGVVSSDESHLVPSEGPGLAPATRYWYRVRGGGANDAVAPWSESNWFETALNSGWSAPGAWPFPFISGENGRRAAGVVTELKRGFEVPFVPVSARLWATALGVYQATVNQQLISEQRLAPGWTAYQSRVAYQTYDVTSWIRQGENTLGATVAPGWYRGELTWLKSRNLYGNRTAFSALLEVRGANGERVTVATDHSWQRADSPWTFADLYHGETYDARREENLSWSPAFSVPTPSVSIVPQDGPPVLPQEVLHATVVANGQPGFVLDFGQNLTGVVRFRTQGRAGDRVILRHAETLDSAGRFYTKNLRRARNRVEYILKGSGIEEFCARFTFQGFRYVSVESWPQDGTTRPRAEDFEALVLHSQMDDALTFECSHPGLNQLHHNIAWGWKGNAVDVPTDCPQRDERLGWTGDVQVFAATAGRLRQSNRFLLKWLRDLRLEQLPSGGVPFVVPDVLSRNPNKEPMMKTSHSSTGWGDAAVLVPWEVYRASGDKRVLEECWPSMLAWVSYVEGQAVEGTLWNTGFHFGDWVALDAKEGSFLGATPNDLTATAYYARSTEVLADVAEILGKTDQSGRLRDRHRRIVAAFQREFVTPSGRLAARTQTAHILALQFNLLSPEHRSRAIADLERLLAENDGHLTTGFLGTPAFCDALTGAGRVDLAYALLLKEDYPSWLYQVGQGATTVWEHWDGLKPDGSMWSPKMNSFNHYAYGAVGDWMYRTIGGIDQERGTAGFRRLVFHPQFGGGLTWARESLKTPYGMASVRWSIDEGRIHVSVRVPPNASARLVLPSGEKALAAGEWSFEEEVAQP